MNDFILKHIFEKNNFNDLSYNQKLIIPQIEKYQDDFIILKQIQQSVEQYNNNYNVYIVGGFVLDSIAGQDSYDIDLTGNIPSDIFIEILTNTLGKDNIKIFSTEKLGTVTCMVGGLDLEYTPFRKEGLYTDNRHPNDIEFTNNIEEDAIRRDFTINALYLSLKNLEILDFFNGIQDFKKGLVRTCGNPEDRFKEDGLRIIRAFRVAAKIDGTIEKNTYNAMVKYYELLDNISNDRLIQEVIKYITKYNNNNIFNLLAKYGNDIEEKNLYYKKIQFQFKDLDKVLNNLPIKDDILTILYYIMRGDIIKNKSYNKKLEEEKKYYNYVIKLLNDHIDQILNISNIEEFTMFLFVRLKDTFVNDYNGFKIIVKAIVNLIYIHTHENKIIFMQYIEILENRDIPLTINQFIKNENIDIQKLLSDGVVESGSSIKEYICNLFKKKYFI